MFSGYYLSLNITVRASTVSSFYLPVLYTHPLDLKTFSCHWYLHTPHAGLPVHFYKQTYWSTSSGLLNILLSNTGFFLFEIFQTYLILFNLTPGSSSAYCSSTVLDHDLCGIELSISASYYSRATLSCLLES